MCDCNKVNLDQIKPTINRYAKETANKAFWYGLCHETLMEGFKECHGIFQPIRAIYKNYSTKTADELIEDAASYVPWNFDSVKDEFKANFIKDFINRSVVIGYFAAWQSKKYRGKICVSFSVCRPSDYPVYLKWESKLNCLMNLNAHTFSDADKLNEVELRLSYKYDRWMYEDANAYYFPILIGDQFEHFIKRCNRYFNKKTKKKIVQKGKKK